MYRRWTIFFDCTGSKTILMFQVLDFRGCVPDFLLYNQKPRALVSVGWFLPLLVSLLCSLLASDTLCYQSTCGFFGLMGFVECYFNFFRSVWKLHSWENVVVVNCSIVHKFTFKCEDWKYLVVTTGGLSWIFMSWGHMLLQSLHLLMLLFLIRLKLINRNWISG
jgi:hypothetical protein